jgi:Fe2+ transport system protein FeoA
MGVWRRRGEAASAGLSAALYSVYSGLYSEAVVSSMASAMALAEVGRFGEAVQYLQKAAKALYEAAKEAFEKVKVTAQHLVELFVEAVARVLAWVDEHKAYLFLMAVVAAGVVALSAALNMWGMIELEKLAHFATGAPFVAGLADAGGRAAERFRKLAERYEKWKIDENAIDRVLKVPLRGERPYTAFLKLSKSTNLPPPLVELRRALARVEGEAERDAAVVAALVLYKTLVRNAEAYGEWAELYKWARSLVEKWEFTVTAEEVKRLREAHRRLEEVAEEVRRELNAVLALYASHSRDLYEKLKPLLEVDVEKAEGLAEAGRRRFSDYSDTGMGTRAYAALLSVARGGLYGHVAMLLMGEGALADVVLLTPRSAYEKAWEIAKGRGEAVDPSRSRVSAAGWEDRAASALLRYLLGSAVDEDLKFRRVEGGFEVFRTYGRVEARVDVLMVEGQPRSKATSEELRRFVEEAKRTAPDLSGFDKAPQYLEWRATDVSFIGKRIVGTTAHPWQLVWYIGVLGEEESFSGGANVTKEGRRLNVTMYWPREREDQILRESRWLESVLGRRVENWRELVDAVDWSRVLERVKELANELRPWIGSEEASDAERESLMGRMLGELTLLAHFAEARRGMDDSRWREERVKRLAGAVEALSGGRITGEYANELARAIIRYAEGHKKDAERRIKNLAKVVGLSMEELSGVVERVLSGEDPYVYCLARDCARGEVVRKFVAPALELVMLDKALRGEFDREEALLLFGEMYATAVAGDGHVGPGEVVLVVGGELGGGAALLRLATLHLLNQLLPDELKFNTRIYLGKDKYYNITATGGDATRFMRLLAVSAPSAGGKYLSDKFNEFVKEAQVEVRLDKDSIRLTKRNVAADLTISEAGAAVKYNVYLRNDKVELQFASTDRSRVELAARLLKLVGVSAEVKKEGGRDVWYLVATTDKLAAGREELRKALAEIVKVARKNRWIDADKAELWLEKLKEGRVLREGWPKCEVGLVEGALVVRFASPNPGSIERQAQRLRDMGLVEGVHFTVKMPEGGKNGYVLILKEGLAYAARLSVRGEGEQRDLAAAFAEHILRRAEEEGDDVHETKEIIEEGKARGSLRLEGFERKVEVGGKEYVVKVIGGGAVEEDRGGRKLLRIRITAEVGRVEGEHTIVDRVVREYTITYGRYGKLNAVVGYAYASVSGGSEADAERLSALIEALTGRRPRVYRIKDGIIMIVCGREHLEGFMRYAELADAIKRWLEETRR